MKYDLDHPLLISKFNNIGITRDAVKQLPPEVRESLAEGSLTPLLLLRHKTDDNTYLMPAKLKIGIDDKTKQPELYVYGVNKSVENNLQLEQKTFDSLKKGQIVLLKEKDKAFYLQIDPETKNTLKLPVKEVEDKLDNIEKILDIELGKEQKQRIKEGKPVTLDVGGEDVTVGIDLKSPNAFKQLQGDIKEWKRQQEIEYDIAHPEYVGLVQTDQNRWEQHMIKTQGLNSQELKQAPQQVKSSGMKL